MLHFTNNSTNNFNVYKSSCLKLDSNPFTCILVNTLTKKEFTFSLTQISFKIRIEFEIELDNIDAGDYTFKLIQNDEIVYMEKLTITKVENNVVLDSLSVEKLISVEFTDIFTFSNEINIKKYLVYKNSVFRYEFNYDADLAGIYEIDNSALIDFEGLITYKIEVLFNDNSIKTILNGVMIPASPNPPLLQFNNAV